MPAASTGPFAAGPPRPGPDVLLTVRSCALDLAPRLDRLVLALHQHLLEMMPTASGRMAGNGRPLCQRLAVGVLEGTSTDRDPAEIAYLLQQVGAANRLEGFPPEEYVSLVHALLRAVRATYRGEWSNATSSAWVEYLIWVRGQLQSGALSVSERDLEAAARQAATPPEPEPPPSGGGLFDDDDDEDDGYREMMSQITLQPRRRRH